jgi:hypothetical protein
MLADGIEQNPEAVCHIAVSHPTAGNPHSIDRDLHTWKVSIGREYISKLRGAKRGEAKRIKAALAEKYHVSESTVRDATAYTRHWLKGLSG